MKRALFLSLLFLSSCTLQPLYERPCMELPQSWRVESSDETTCANVEWWQELGDPILDELIVQALRNNRDLLAAAWRVCDFYFRYQIVNSRFYPQIDLEGSALRERFPEQSSFLPAGFNPIQSQYRFAFHFSLDIDLWGEIRSLSDEAFAQLMASVENRREVVLTLVANVARTYILLRQLDAQLVIAMKTLQERAEYLRLAKLRFEGGLTSEIEVTQAASVYEETEAAVVALNKLIPLEEDLLSVLIGENPTCIIRGRSIDKFWLPPAIPTGLPCELLERRPDILRAESLILAANANIGVARAHFFPRFTLTGLFGGDSFELNTLFSKSSRAWAIGGSFLQPIFTGGRLTNELYLSLSEMQVKIFEYEQTVLNAFKEVNDALISHKQSLKLEIVEKRRVQALTEYLRLAWLRYYDGETDYLTVLDAERELFNSQIDLVKAQGDIFLSLVDIYKSLGGGWVLDADGKR